MDWSNTKTIFIIIFLFLNVFLAYQLMEKQQHSHFSELLHESMQELLQENIEINVSNPEEPITGSPILGSLQSFNEETLHFDRQIQDIEIFGQMLSSQLVSPYPLNRDTIELGVETFLQEYVYRGEQYRFHRFDEEDNVIHLQQLYEGNPISNQEQESHIKLFMNDDFEIQSYQQEYWVISEGERQQEILLPLEAIERLYIEGKIPRDTVIDYVELGYYSLLPSIGQNQVYTPMWKVEVNDTFQLVDAIDGSITSQ
ncbi:two-component system regulatory protein YycI [Evansella cellulosilytica]|uniref:Regulatory protein YycH-like domain-containing protein n=1 Tax=Evansella cellulosilytica (strain ATCC 21833 / DSM 2522 / FERM P-1141 / JCM 9156 / N-4) TaxID=649639 RepID=E6TZW4_EVAC2|nr:two-component system regulatory protein YycI [Evansella cellulosilytica]ADU32530.1 Protein of unknown function YycH [Evansella cellulosilytica DSM 2522]